MHKMHLMVAYFLEFYFVPLVENIIANETQHHQISYSASIDFLLFVHDK